MNSNSHKQETIALLVIVILSIISLTSLFIAFSYYCYIRTKLSNRRKVSLSFKSKDITANNHNDVEKVQSFEKQSTKLEEGDAIKERRVEVFGYKQLLMATGGFGKGNVVGNGSFGSVYKGLLNDGRKIAVKLMDVEGRQGEEEFKMEVDLLTRLKSPYLLGLVGYCSDNSRRMLVYEFMANGGLQEHLYPIRGGVSKLSWEIRMKIALEAAKGLEYLHEHVNPPVIHRDFKSSNILLDRNFHAKVSDFGLAKLGSDKAGGHVSTRVLGTQGYVAPEYAMTGHLTTKSDVYSYGVVLLELLSGRVPVDKKRPPGEAVLVSWALPWLTDREKVVHIMDPALEGQYSIKEAVQVAAIAAMCVQPEADYRPLMADVVQSLVPLVKHHRSTSKVGSSSTYNTPPKSPMFQESLKSTF